MTLLRNQNTWATSCVELRSCSCFDIAHVLDHGEPRWRPTTNCNMQDHKIIALVPHSPSNLILNLSTPYDIPESLSADSFLAYFIGDRSCNLQQSPLANLVLDGSFIEAVWYVAFRNNYQGLPHLFSHNLIFNLPHHHPHIFCKTDGCGERGYLWVSSYHIARPLLTSSPAENEPNVIIFWHVMTADSTRY